MVAVSGTFTDHGDPIPGSVHLVDINHNLDVVHGDSRQKDVILVPQPSADPEDPLNWKKWRKHMTYFWASWFVFFAAGQSAALSPALLTMEKEMNISLADLNSGTGYLFLFYGIGCLFWQPFALAYGRRFTLIFGSVVGGIACQFWLAECRSTGNYFANRIVTGFILSPVESLVEIIVTDLYFAHERGFFLGIYIFALGGSSFLCPLASGFINDSMGWKWIPYWFAILFGVGAIGSFFFLEETMYYRENTEADVNEIQDESVEAATGEEKAAGKTAYSSSKEVGASVDQSEENPSTNDYHIKSFVERLALFDKKQVRSSMFIPSVYRPLLILYKFPPVVIGGLVVASSLSWFNVLSATLADVLGNTYDFSNSGISLFYLAPAIGTIIVCMVGGKLSDMLCVRLAKRNHGIREPEFRMYMGLTGIILNPLGMWLYGIGAAKGLHWSALLFGCGMVGYCINLGAIVPYAYVLDAYKEMGGDAVVSLVLIRNLCGFAFAYAITPWIEHQGLLKTFLVVGILSMVFWMICIPMILFGKRLRVRTARSYQLYLAKHRHE